MDVAIGKIRILHITDHWPFKPETEFSHAVENYVPQNRAEVLAKEVFRREINSMKPI